MKQNSVDPYTERHVPVRSKEDLLFAVEHLCRSAPIGMALLDTDLRFVHVNELMAEANRTLADAHVDKTLHEIIPDIASKVEQLCLRVIDTGKEILDVEISSAFEEDPELLRYWLASFYPLRTGDGTLEAVGVLIRDISAQKAAELRVLTEKRFSENVIESMPGLFHLLSEDGRLVRWNRMTETVLGYSPEELANMNIRDLSVSEHEPGVERAFDRAFRKGSASTEGTLLTKDGRRIPVLANGVRITIDGVNYLCGLQLDISIQKRAEKELDERLRFELLLSELSAAFINLPAHKIDAEIEHWLRRLVEFLGIDRSSFYQYSSKDSKYYIAHCWAVEGVEKFSRNFTDERLVHFPEKVRQGEIVKLSRIEDLPEAWESDRQVFKEWGIKSGMAIPLQVGETFLGLLGFGSFHAYREWPEELVQRLRLVGEILANALVRKKALDETRQLQEQLAHASRVSAMGELAASLAHELNQPLAAILSNAQAAQHFLKGEKPDLGELRETLADIVRDDRRAGEVISRIRSYLKKEEPEHAPLDINAAIREVLRLIGNEIERERIIMHLDLADNLPTVRGDRIQIEQVLLNLIMNGLEAVRAVKDGRKELGIQTSRNHSDTITVAVQDSGIGIDPKHMDQIFDPFFSTTPHGMGMGLSICRSIVKAHGGKLRVMENPAGGTKFYFTLPGSREVRNE